MRDERPTVQPPMIRSTTPFDAAAEPPALAERQVVDERDLRRVRQVAGRSDVAAHVDRPAERQEVALHRLAVGVADLELQALRVAAAQLELQAVVVGAADVGRQVRAALQVGIGDEEVRGDAGGRGVGAPAGIAAAGCWRT